MSLKDESNPNDLPASRSSSTDNLAAVAPQQRRITPPNEILFLDNTQDARSMRSTIQRHTANHAAAQRREARLQSSRERTPRNLEWQRRPSLETSTSSASDASASIPSAPVTSDTAEPTRQVRLNEDAGDIGAGNDRRGQSTEIFQNNAIGPGETRELPVSSAVLRHIEADEIGRRVLDAYQLALRAQSLPIWNTQHWEAREGSLEQVNRVLSVLRQRVASEHEGCSDQTIQAVLVLFVYASRFQTPEEATSHRAALERMISLRGGLDSFGENIVLARQLEVFASGDDVQQILRITSLPGQRY